MRTFDLLVIFLKFILTDNIVVYNAAKFSTVKVAKIDTLYNPAISFQTNVSNLWHNF
jgi:hypothetical protein